MIEESIKLEMKIEDLEREIESLNMLIETLIADCDTCILNRDNAELKKIVKTLATAINNCAQASYSGAICRHTIGVTAALEAAKGVKNE